MQDRGYGAYRAWKPRFVAEFGYQAPANYSTLREAVELGELREDSPVLRHHQKAVDGRAKLQRGLEEHFASVDTFDDWLFATQLNQARAITTGIDHFRALRPLCMGTILWQLNDCWPALSWSVVDSAARPKPAWCALRRAYADRLLTIQPTGNGLAVVAINDSDDEWRGAVRMRRMNVDGAVLTEEFTELIVAPRAHTNLPLSARLANAAHGSNEFVVADLGTNRATWFFERDSKINYPVPRYETKIMRIDRGFTVDVFAHTLLRELALFVDRMDPQATVDDMLVTLLPGESVIFRVTTTHDTAEELGSAPFLHCPNDLSR
ncbi:hypothetical protein [Streptomyces sp. NPDC006510]|uniref:hypothetical protein n=1 Tax=Streptomyces sp. NPDC006510 TaxID=3155600 RepID=UPI0033B49968